MNHTHCKSLSFAVTLLWAELEFDVKYYIKKHAKLQGVQGKDAENYEFTKSDMDWMLRQFDTAAGNLRSALKWAVKNLSRSASDELLDQPLDYSFAFVLEDEWLGNIDNLKTFMHEYIVHFTIANWCRMNNDNNKDEEKAEAEDNLQKAVTELNSVLIETPTFRL